MDVQSILNKYTKVSIDSLNLEKDLLDIEKDIILEKESQEPDIVISSNRPFDKNYCYYDLHLKNSVKENIFPKKKYILKDQLVINPLDIDAIFDENKNILENNPENEIKKKKLDIITKGKYKEYVPKIKLNLTLEQVFSYEKNNKWYLIKDDGPLGPFNDYNLYKYIKDIYYYCLSNNKQIPYYLVKEEKEDVYLTMEECFKNLNKKFTKEIRKNMPYPNMIFYRYPNMANLAFFNNINNNVQKESNKFQKENNYVELENKKPQKENNNANFKKVELKVDDFFNDNNNNFN